MGYQELASNGSLLRMMKYGRIIPQFGMCMAPQGFNLDPATQLRIIIL